MNKTNFDAHLTNEVVINIFLILKISISFSYQQKNQHKT